MRKLSVKRKFSIVECATKLYLYVQCPKRESTHKIDGINYVRYRLRNGKTVEVDIPDEPVAIRIETSITGVSMIIPEGTEDIALQAKPRYAPKEGNPFEVKVIE